jgi:hypothetical protein
MTGIIPSEPTNYHPAFASTTDEYLILDCMVESLIGVDVYTHQDIPWLATKWNVTDWPCTLEGAPAVGMNTTFWLRDDVYFHDGVLFDAYTCEFSLEWLKEMEIGRAQAMWRDLHDVTVYNSTCFSVFHNVSSLWTFYDIAGWAPAVPPHIYNNTALTFRPEATAHPWNGNLTMLVSTGPYWLSDLDFRLGGYAELSAFRVDPAKNITAHWWQSVEGYDAWLLECFHWVGDLTTDGYVDIYDLTKLGKAFAAIEPDPRYDPAADIDPEPTYHTRASPGIVNMRDLIELSKLWGKQATYA